MCFGIIQRIKTVISSRKLYLSDSKSFLIKFVKFIIVLFVFILGQIEQNKITGF
jgi:hypothetical protein